MKKMKLFFALAVVLAMASAFATPRHSAKLLNTYIAVYSGSDFTWQLLEGTPGYCIDNSNGHYCMVEADSQPADNTVPPGATAGDYQP